MLAPSCRPLNRSQAYAAQYLAGRTLRQIAENAGLCHTTIRYHLRKLTDYRAIVAKLLTRRVREAERAYNVTRGRAEKRRLKHSLAMLAQKRPAMVRGLIERTKPKHCPDCGHDLAPRMLNGWRWTCGYCGEGGHSCPGGIAGLFLGTLPAHSQRFNGSKPAK